MILRDATLKELTQRRDELRAQLAGVDHEIARRFREESRKQQEARTAWDRENPYRSLER